MTRDQLSAMEQRLNFQITTTREQLLRLEGYRHCLADIIKADDDAAAKAAAEAPTAPPIDQPAAPENTDAQTAQAAA